MIPGANAASRGRFDGARVLCWYLGLLLLIPARLIIAGLPIKIAPAVVAAALVGLLWLGVQMTSTLSVAKGRNIVRTALGLLFAGFLMTYAVATRRYMEPEQLNLADSGMIRITGILTAGLFACDCVRGRFQIDRVLKVFVGITAVVSAVGILQFASFDLIPYVNIPGLKMGTDNFSYVLSRSSFNRPSGTANHPIEFGVLCAAALPISIHYVLFAKDDGRSAARWWMALILIGGGGLLSLSRTAIIGLLITIIVLLVTLPRHQKVVVGIVGGLFLTAVGVAVPGLLGTLLGLFTGFAEDSSITHRTNDYPTAFVQVDLHPLLGRGFGTYLPTIQLLDNQFLLTMIENGYIGLLLLTGVFVAGSFAALRARALLRDTRARNLGAALFTCMLVLVVGTLTFDLISFGMAAGMLFVLVGITGAFVRSAREERAAGRHRPAAGEQKVLT